jgi:hypothetical protein
MDENVFMSSIVFKDAQIEQTKCLGWTLWMYVHDTKSIGDTDRGILFRYRTRLDALEACRRFGIEKVVEIFRSEAVTKLEVTV